VHISFNTNWIEGKRRIFPVHKLWFGLYNKSHGHSNSKFDHLLLVMGGHIISMRLSSSTFMTIFVGSKLLILILDLLLPFLYPKWQLGVVFASVVGLVYFGLSFIGEIHIISRRVQSWKISNFEGLPQGVRLFWFMEPIIGCIFCFLYESSIKG